MQHRPSIALGKTEEETRAGFEGTLARLRRRELATGHHPVTGSRRPFSRMLAASWVWSSWAIAGNGRDACHPSASRCCAERLGPKRRASRSSEVPRYAGNGLESGHPHLPGGQPP